MEKKFRLIGLGIFFTLLCTAATGFTWHLAQPSATLRIMPQAVKIRVGEQVTVDLTIEKVSELYGAQIHLKFDPSVIKVIDADPGQEGVQIEPGTLPIPDFVVLNAVDNQAGTIDYASTQLPPNKPGEGDGVIASVTFQAKKAAVSDIQFDQYLLADTKGGNINATPQHGQIRVRGNLSWMFIAAAGLALLLTAGVIAGLVFVKRK
jgi:hypothetical protein